MPARSWTDSRVHRSGGSLLGTLEGRPGIMNISSIEALLPPLGREVVQVSRERTPELTERIQALEIVKDNPESNLEDMIWDAYFDAEDFGVMVDYDVDSDSDPEA